jgi:hypothetical protein
LDFGLEPPGIRTPYQRSGVGASLNQWNSWTFHPVLTLSKDEKKFMPISKAKAASVSAEKSQMPTPSLADPEVQERLQEELKKWDAEVEHQIETSRSSERLTESDFAIRINAKA